MEIPDLCSLLFKSIVKIPAQGDFLPARILARLDPDLKFLRLHHR